MHVLCAKEDVFSKETIGYTFQPIKPLQIYPALASNKMVSKIVLKQTYQSTFTHLQPSLIAFCYRPLSINVLTSKRNPVLLPFPPVWCSIKAKCQIWKEISIWSQLTRKQTKRPHLQLATVKLLTQPAKRSIVRISDFPHPEPSLNISKIQKTIFYPMTTKSWHYCERLIINPSPIQTI